MKTGPSSVLLVGLFANALSAQSRFEAQPLSGTRIPIHTADGSEGLRYGTWAAGDSYKASFHDGMTFVPFLGADYPRTQPWSWRTTSVRIGQRELLSGAAPAHAHTDHRYEYRYGVVTEAYDVLVDGLEQTFVVDFGPATGDLVITGEIGTALHAPDATAAHQALTFCDDAGRAIVDYGRAFAVDGAGDRIELVTSYAAGRITLTVPAEWLQSASLPVTVDPLLARNSLMAETQTVYEVDIARSREGTANLVAYTRAASGIDRDVVAVARGGLYGWNGGTTIFADLTTNWSSDGASCACQDENYQSHSTNQSYWAVAFRRYYLGQTPRSSRIFVHIRPVDAQLRSNTIQLPCPTGHNDWRPSIAGTSGFTVQNGNPVDRLLVVCQGENNTANGGNMLQTTASYIAAGVLDPNQTGPNTWGTFGFRFHVQNGPSLDAERPNVTKNMRETPFAAGAVPYHWVCAWQELDNSAAADDWDVKLRRMDRNGTPIGQITGIPDNANDNWHKLGPVVEGSRGRFAVGYAKQDLASSPTTTTIRGKEVWVQRFDWDTTSSAAMPHPSVRIDGDNSAWFEVRGLGHDTADRSHFALSYVKYSQSLYRLHYALLGYTGNPTETGSILLLTSTAIPGGGCIFDYPYYHFGYCFGSTISTSQLEYASSSGVSWNGNSCSTATLNWLGSTVIGSEFTGPAMVNANGGPNDLHFLFVSFQPADQLIVNPGVAPGCRLLVANGPPSLGAMELRIGQLASWSLPLPEWLQPMTLHFQDWIFNGSQFESTYRMTVSFAR